MNLYEVCKEIETLFAEIEEAQGEFPPHFEKVIESLELSRDRKIESFANRYKNLGLLIESIDSEARRLKRKKKAAIASMEWIEKYLMHCLGGNEFQVGARTVSWRPSERVEIIDHHAVPDQYCRIEVVREPALDVIKRDLKCGADLPWAVLVKPLNIRVA
jgi:hypothetical protein